MKNKKDADMYIDSSSPEGINANLRIITMVEAINNLLQKGIELSGDAENELKRLELRITHHFNGKDMPDAD